MTQGMQISGATLAAAPEALRKARGALLGRQHAEGYWCGELTAGTTFESD